MLGEGSFYVMPNVCMKMLFPSPKEDHFGICTSLYREISDPCIGVLYEHCS